MASLPRTPVPALPCTIYKKHLHNKLCHYLTPLLVFPYHLARPPLAITHLVLVLFVNRNRKGVLFTSFPSSPQRVTGHHPGEKLDNANAPDQLRGW